MASLLIELRKGLAKLANFEISIKPRIIHESWLPNHLPLPNFPENLILWLLHLWVEANFAHNQHYKWVLLLDQFVELFSHREEQIFFQKVKLLGELLQRNLLIKILILEFLHVLGSLHYPLMVKGLDIV